MNFYGLLHISDEGRHSPNLKARSSPAAISSYVANAVTLANSLRAVGCDFTVVTNDEARLTEINGAGLGANVAVTEISFGTRVPKDILFYSAHHKVDVYRWFSTFAADDYPVLIDFDMVALRPPSTAFIACVSSGIPLVYDISDQVFPVFGEDTIAADLERLLGPQVPLRRWYRARRFGQGSADRALWRSDPRLRGLPTAARTSDGTSATPRFSTCHRASSPAPSSQPATSGKASSSPTPSPKSIAAAHDEDAARIGGWRILADGRFLRQRRPLAVSTERRARIRGGGPPRPTR